jgi:hypothetical protein
MMNVSGRIRSSRIVQIGVVLALVSALLIGVFLPANAGSSMPVITVLNVIPSSLVQVQISNLPAGVTFRVTQGAAGTQGIGGAIVANFESASGSGTFLFEIATPIKNNAKVDLRIDGGTYYAYVTFANVAAAAPAPAVTPAPAATPKPATPATGAKVVHVQKGGLVVVEMNNMPGGQTFEVYISKPGGGSKTLVAHVDTVLGASFLTYFEIPVTLSTQPTLEVRIENSAYLYVLPFSNVNF